jgi:hypothetical protein
MRGSLRGILTRKFTATNHQTNWVSKIYSAGFYTEDGIDDYIYIIYISFIIYTTGFVTQNLIKWLNQTFEIETFIIG